MGNMGPAATYEVKASGWDAKRSIVCVYAVFAGYSDYVCSIEMDSETRKVCGLTKVWNDVYAKENMPKGPLKGNETNEKTQALTKATGASKVLNANALFAACEQGKGWDACKE